MATRSESPSRPARSWLVTNTGGAAIGQLRDQLLEEGAAHDGVEAQGGVVEDQHFGRVAEAEGEHDRPAFSARQATEGCVEGNVEARETSFHPGPIPARVESAAKIRQLTGGHARRGVGLLGKHADAIHGLPSLGPGVLAEQEGPAGGRLLLPEETAYERRLARAVAPEEREHAPRGHREGHVVQQREAPVADRQALYGKGWLL